MEKEKVAPTHFCLNSNNFFSAGDVWLSLLLFPTNKTLFKVLGAPSSPLIGPGSEAVLAFPWCRSTRPAVPGRGSSMRV